jgi:para-aminobenzoate synthetase component 1
MIRYIEQKDGQMFYKSGGGITMNSDLEKEYNELIDKVYVTAY